MFDNVALPYEAMPPFETKDMGLGLDNPKLPTEKEMAFENEIEKL